MAGRIRMTAAITESGGGGGHDIQVERLVIESVQASRNGSLK
jgi:hypothetical protein